LGLFRALYLLLAGKFRVHSVTIAVPGIMRSVKIRLDATDKQVFEQIFVDNDYALPTDIQPRFIIDGGANVGYASIYFSNRYPDADIVAVEPDPFNFEVLCENVKGYPQIRPLKAAIWKERSLLRVDNSLGSWACTVSEVRSEELLDTNQPPYSDALTLDDICLRAGQDKIDILKLDIEGAELEVFAAPCQSWLAKTGVIIIELHDRMKPGCSDALERAIEGHSFSRSTQGENLVLIRTELSDQQGSQEIPSGHQTLSDFSIDPV
jgi:FkbM family methyltransferase